MLPLPAQSVRKILITIILLMILGLIATTFFLLKKTEQKPAQTQQISQAASQISLKKPQEGEKLSGLVLVTLNIPENQQFSYIDFFIDNRREAKIVPHLKQTVQGLEANFRFDTSRFNNGDHLLTLNTVFSDNQIQTSYVRVNFANQIKQED